MTTPLTIECKLPCWRRRRAQAAPSQARQGSRASPREPGSEQSPLPERPAEPGRVPRIARLLALALRFEQLLRAGTVRDYVALATLGHVSRARITQIMNLLLLSPQIQEQILFLPRVESGRDPIPLSQLQPLAATLDWPRQRRMWDELQRRSSE